VIEHKAASVLIEKPKEDEVAEMLTQIEHKLDRQAKEVEEREHKQARAHDLESSDNEDMKKQLMKLIQGEYKYTLKTFRATSRPHGKVRELIWFK
jgi:hypothetical protein